MIRKPRSLYLSLFATTFAACLGVDDSQVTDNRSVTLEVDELDDDQYEFTQAVQAQGRNLAVIEPYIGHVDFGELYQISNSTLRSEYFGGADKVVVRISNLDELKKTRSYGLFQDTVPLKDLVYPVTQACAEQGYTSATYASIKACLDEAIVSANALVFAVSPSRPGIVFGANTVGRAIEDVVDGLWGASTGLLKQKNVVNRQLVDRVPTEPHGLHNEKFVSLSCISCHSAVTSVGATDGSNALPRIDVDTSASNFVTSSNTLGYTLTDLFSRAEDRLNAGLVAKRFVRWT